MPIFFLGSEGMTANPEFHAAVGYKDIANVQGGFGGARSADGRVVVQRWRDAGLPVSTEASEALSYEGLRRKAGL